MLCFKLFVCVDSLVIKPGFLIFQKGAVCDKFYVLWPSYTHAIKSSESKTAADVSLIEQHSCTSYDSVLFSRLTRDDICKIGTFLWRYIRHDIAYCVQYK